MDARPPRSNDLSRFEELEPGDVVNFFEWPVEPLTVLARESDGAVGTRVRVEAEGSESFIYEVDGCLWHYVPEDEYSGANNPFPVQSLRRVDESS